MKANTDVIYRALNDFVDQEHIDCLFLDLPGATPTPLRVLAGCVVLLFLLGAIALWSVPWIQTATGGGQVVALNPADRVQAISALVDGRINRWYVNDGSIVKAGDPIVEIADVDPRFLERMQAERAAVAHQLNAGQIASETALLNYERRNVCLTTDSAHARTSRPQKLNTRRLAHASPVHAQR